MWLLLFKYRGVDNAHWVHGGLEEAGLYRNPLQCRNINHIFSYAFSHSHTRRSFYPEVASASTTPMQPLLLDPCYILLLEQWQWSGTPTTTEQLPAFQHSVPQDVMPAPPWKPPVPALLKQSMVSSSPSDQIPMPKGRAPLLQQPTILTEVPL